MPAMPVGKWCRLWWCENQTSHLFSPTQPNAHLFISIFNPSISSAGSPQPGDSPEFHVRLVGLSVALANSNSVSRASYKCSANQMANFPTNASWTLSANFHVELADTFSPVRLLTQEALELPSFDT
jgi:hypothetical protein